jgi:hypothetical protein
VGVGGIHRVYGITQHDAVLTGGMRGTLRMSTRLVIQRGVEFCGFW